jgi:hypothetical protein
MFPFTDTATIAYQWYSTTNTPAPQTGSFRVFAEASVPYAGTL